jgi:hypothetical protein
MAPPEALWRSVLRSIIPSTAGDEKGDADGGHGENHGAGPKRGAQAPDKGLAGRIGEPLALSSPEPPGDPEC